MKQQIINLTGSNELNLSTLEHDVEEATEVTLVASVPVVGIAILVEKQGDTTNAAKKWLELASVAIDLYKKHYDKTTLKVVSNFADSHLAGTEEPSTVNKVIASMLTSDNPEIKKSLEWLTACASNAAEVNNAAQNKQDLIESLLTEWEEASKATADPEETEQLKEENELLLLQLQQVQEELEHYFIKCKELEGGKKTHQSSMSPSFVQPPIAQQHESITDSPAWRFIAPVYAKLDKLINHLIYKRHAKVVKKSKLFDKKWYQKTYQDVKGFKGGAALHYVAHGGAEGRDPGPDFSSERYLAMNPDVAEKGINPLVHYELFGKKEGRFY